VKSGEESESARDKERDRERDREGERHTHLGIDVLRSLLIEFALVFVPAHRETRETDRHTDKART